MLQNANLVQRSLLFRFPDVITYKAIPVTKNFDICVPEQSEVCSNAPMSTIALHTYSVYGRGDFGVNANRAKIITDELVVDLGNMNKEQYTEAKEPR